MKHLHFDPIFRQPVKLALPPSRADDWLTRSLKNRPLDFRRARPWLAFMVLVGLIIGLLGFGQALAGRPVSTLYDLARIFQAGRYLVLLQNNAEIRPSGGFIGSFFVIEVSDRKVNRLTFETNIYKQDNAFAARPADSRLSAPLYEKLWPGHPLTLRDSNYEIDWPSAAETILSLYASEYDDPAIDGVVTVNASAIAKLLGLIGPVELPKYSITLTQENFFATLHQYIENDYFKKVAHAHQNEPKTILAEAMPILVNRLLNVSPIALAKLVDQALTQKDLLIAVKDPLGQKLARQRDWDGAVSQLKSNFLMISRLNIAGNKTSRLVVDKIEVDLSDRDRLSVSLSRVINPSTEYGVSAVPNQEYVGFLVPFGSQLVDANLNGQSIIEELMTDFEAGKQLWRYHLVTQPGQANWLTVDYELPDDLKPMPLIIKKQPGSLNTTLLIKDGSRLLYSGWLDRDLVISGQ